MGESTEQKTTKMANIEKRGFLAQQEFNSPGNEDAFSMIPSSKTFS